MRFGVGFFATDQTVAPDVLGRMVEERAFASLYLTEHTHMPVEHTPHPSGADLPEWYRRTLDPFVALSAIAAVTRHLRLGFGVSLVAQRDPLVTAKAVASLDWLSGGRVELGIGAGWNVPEAANHGVPFDRRFKVMREHVEAMRAVWTDEVASFDGEFVSFSRVWSWPKPVQDPLPVLVGGHGAGVVDRILRYADGWMPMVEEGLADRIAELRARADGAGIPRPRVVFFGAPLRPEPVERLWEAGVDECLFMIRTGPSAVVEDCLDRAAAVAGTFRVTPRERFASARVARLATAGPHVVPICFALDGDVIWSAVDGKPKRTRQLRRLENIARDPRVSVLVDEYSEDWSALWWARADGVARVLGDGPVELLAERYPQYAEAPPAGPFIAVDVERWSGWEAS